MEYNYPKFTKEMKQTHTILIPNMAILQFRILKAALEKEGYKVEILNNCGSEVAQLGLKYVHNDTCYPALLVIGQFLDALNSGRYDLDRTALLITQTGGGCRASNYIHLLRKALVKAGYPQVPVASLNFSGLEKDSGFKLTLKLARKALASVFYGDLIMALRNQCKPYEVHEGDTLAMTEKWIAACQKWMKADCNYSARDMKKQFPVICRDFASIPLNRVPKVKVGIVGEIYVKYSPLGNNELEKFLESEDCEVNMPGLMGFLEYCIFNMGEDVTLYGGKANTRRVMNLLLRYLDGIEIAAGKALSENGFHAPARFAVLKTLPDVKMVLAHMGGCGNWHDVLEVVAGSKVILDCAYSLGFSLDMEGKPMPSIPRLLTEERFMEMVNVLGPERILFGTDSPWTDQRHSLEQFLSLPLSPEARERILYQNALDLYNLQSWLEEEEEE